MILLEAVLKNNSWFKGILSFIKIQLINISFADILDILLLAFMIYFAVKFLHVRRAGKLIFGVTLWILFLAFSRIFHLYAVGHILSYFLQAGIIAIVVLFQPELRDMLEKLGAEPFKSLRSISGNKANEKIAMIDNICEAVVDMARTKTGALIVIERDTNVSDIIRSGVRVDAKISPYLLRNIFFDGSPLHDGAVVIRDYRIYAASCMLPLTNSEEVIATLGTRHRAAIGISEVSDAVVVVVSEETGIVSVAMNGTLKRNYRRLTLKQTLLNSLVGPNYKNLDKDEDSPNKNK
jgi:diadenylate cyclase